MFVVWYIINSALAAKHWWTLILNISSASHLQQDLLWCCTEAELFCNRTLSDDFNTDNNTVTFQFGHKHIRSMFPLSSISLHSIKNTKSLFRLRSCFLWCSRPEKALGIPPHTEVTQLCVWCLKLGDYNTGTIIKQCTQAAAESLR